MLIKSKDIAPNSQATAWVVAEALGYIPELIYDTADEITGKPHQVIYTGVNNREFNHLSLEVVLEVIKWLLADGYYVCMGEFEEGVAIRLFNKVMAEGCESLESAIIACLLRTREEWEVPGELCGSYMTKSETQD